MQTIAIVKTSYRGKAPIQDKILVDDQDYQTMSSIHWIMEIKSDGRRYAVHGRPRIYLHRLLMGSPAKHVQVDHKNGNGLDNRRSNLRLATPSQNQQNRRGLPRNNTSGFRGVHWSRGRNKWLARVRLDGHLYNLGRYKTRTEAAKVAAAFRAKHMPFSKDADRGE